MEKLALIFTAILVFLRPHIGVAVFATYAADFVIVGLMIVMMIIRPYRYNTNLRPLRNANLILLVLLAVVALINSITGDYPIGTVVNYGRFVYYSWFFWFSISLMASVSGLMDAVFSFLNRSYYIIFWVAIIQLFAIPGLSSVVKTIFGTAKLRSIWGGYPRVYSTFYNANWFGVYLVFILLAWVSLFQLEYLSTRRFVLRIISTIFLFAVAGSRTAIVGLFVAGVTWFLLNRRLKHLIGLVSSGIFIFRFFEFLGRRYLMLARTISRFETLLYSVEQRKVLDDSLTSGRYSKWVLNLNAVAQKPILGYGDIGDQLPHNSYLTLLICFGIVGIFILAVFLLFGLRLIARLQHSQTKGREIMVLNQWVISFLISFATMALAAEFIYTTQVMLVCLLLIAWWTTTTVSAGVRCN